YESSPEETTDVNSNDTNNIPTGDESDNGPLYKVELTYRIELYPGTQTPFTNMYNQGLIPQQIFSVQLRPARNKTTYGGIFIFGGIDSRLYQGPITYTPVTYKFFWQIGIDAVEYNGKSVTKSSNSQKQQAIENMILSSNTWQVPCNLKNNVEVSIKINGVSLPINYKDLVRESVSSGSRWCYSGIGSTDSSIWILGGTFMKNYYVIFDLEQDQVGFATPVYNY
ncbi:16685_t:CDS:2, partial [Racocetra persica]